MEETDISCYIADHPMECVALGTGKALEELDRLRVSGTVIPAIRKGGRRLGG
jgi:rod shape-determining protein MreB